VDRSGDKQEQGAGIRRWFGAVREHDVVSHSPVIGRLPVYRTEPCVSFYQLKEWLKTATPLGRFVNMNRLHIDPCEDSDERRRRRGRPESAGLLSRTSSGTSETRV
jgi:hypothetical protein